MGETLLSPDGVRLTLGVFDMDLGISPAGVQAKEVVTLYGYDSYDFVQPSTYPHEWVTSENVDIVFDGDEIMELKSTCRYPFQVQDWGKNKTNIDRLLASFIAGPVMVDASQLHFARSSAAASPSR